MVYNDYSKSLFSYYGVTTQTAPKIFISQIKDTEMIKYEYEGKLEEKEFYEFIE